MRSVNEFTATLNKKKIQKMKKTFSPFSKSIIHSDGSVTTYTREHIIIETLEGLKYLPRKNKKP